MLVQVYVVFNVSSRLGVYQVYLFKFFTILSYANSAINPFLYAFTNDAFKTAFADAFSCVASSRSQSTRDCGRGGGPRRDAGVAARRANQDEMRAAAPDRSDRQDCGNTLQLETVITKRQTQVHVINNDDDDSRQMRVIVHLEHQQQQQQPNEPSATDHP